MLHRLLLPLAFLALNGCGGFVVSQNFTKLEDQRTSVAYYSLPRVLLPITLTVTRLGAADGGGGGPVTSGAPSAPAKPDDGSAKSKPEDKQPVFDGTVRGSGEIFIIQDGHRISLKVDKAIVTADPSATYRLTYDESIFASDDLKVRIDQNGLLQSVQAEADDRTAEALVKLTKLASSVVFLATGMPPVPQMQAAREKMVPVRCNLLAPFTRTILFDAGNAEWTSQQFIGLEQKGLRVRMQLRGQDFVSPSVPPGCPIVSLTVAKTGETELADELKQGIAFRRALPTHLTFAIEGFDQNASGYASYTDTDRKSLFIVDVPRSRWIKRTTKIIAADGMLAGVDINKPSQAAAFMQMPLDALNAVFEGPSNLLSLRVTHTTNEANLLKQQEAALGSIKRILELQREVDELKQRTGVIDASQ